MFPTLANLFEYSLDGDPDLTHAAVHAVNQWMHEVWSFDYQSRIFTMPVITLPIVEEAIKELEWVLERGAKASWSGPLLSPVCAAPGRSPSPSSTRSGRGCRRRACRSACTPRSRRSPPTTRRGSRAERQRVRRPAQEHADPAPGDRGRPGGDALRGRAVPLPDLSAERRERRGVGRPPAPRARPRTGRCPRSSPSTRSTSSGATSTSARSGRTTSPSWSSRRQRPRAFGSDYPHPEGLAEPLEYLDTLRDAQLDDTTIRQVMSTNANALLGVPMAA